MAAFDLGLVNGDNWGAAQVDAVELAISTRGVETCTTAQRLAISGAQLTNGKVVFDTTLREHLYYDSTDTTWHGLRTHRYQFASTTGASAFNDNTQHTASSTTLPDFGVPGRWVVTGRLAVQLITFGGTGAGEIVVSLWLGGVEVSQHRAPCASLFGAGQQITGINSGDQTQVAGATTSCTMTVTQTSPGNSSWFGVGNDYRFNRIDALFIPS